MMLLMNYGLVDIEELDTDDISTVPIAQALGRINRFCGNFNSMTVAQHAYLCSLLVARFSGTLVEQLAALHHDDSEAFTGDIPSPVKKACPQLLAIENSILDVIDEKYSIKTRCPLVKEIDHILGRKELLYHMDCNPSLPRNMSIVKTTSDKQVTITASTMIPWSYNQVVAKYIDRHDELMRELAVETIRVDALMAPPTPLGKDVN